jgi:hypothetical protein
MGFWLARLPNGQPLGAGQPDKVRGVEFGSARSVLNAVRHQPRLVLHELAHGHHNRDCPHPVQFSTPSPSVPPPSTTPS